MVVLGSDGLFDNRWEDDLVALVQARLEVSLALPLAQPLLLPFWCFVVDSCLYSLG